MKSNQPLCVSTSQASSWQWSFLQHVVVLRQRTGWRRLHSLRRGSPAGVQKGDQQCAGDIIHILELREGSQPGKLMKTVFTQGIETILVSMLYFGLVEECLTSL